MDKRDRLLKVLKRYFNMMAVHEDEITCICKDGISRKVIIHKNTGNVIFYKESTAPMPHTLKTCIKMDMLNARDITKAVICAFYKIDEGHVSSVK